MKVESPGDPSYSWKGGGGGGKGQHQVLFHKINTDRMLSGLSLLGRRLWQSSRRPFCTSVGVSKSGLNSSACFFGITSPVAMPQKNRKQKAR